MPSPGHEVYRKHILEWSRKHAKESDVVAALERYQDALLILWELDLEPARPFLMQGYAENPRGGNPWDPVTLLRVLLLSILVGQPRINPWVADLKASRVLALLAGVLMEPKGKAGRCPAVATLYGFMHRLHDGPGRRPCPHSERPSTLERRRAKAPRKIQRRLQQSKAKRKRQRKQDKKLRANSSGAKQITAKLIDTLKERQNQKDPNDLLMRLAQILIEVAVKPSAKRGLLGKLNEIRACGDGTPLPTGANRHGKKTCDCPTKKPCECPRTFSDPDARLGYDSHRDKYYFGHRLYEVVTSAKGHDLPLALRLDPANTSDYTAAPKCIEHLRKLLHDQSDMQLGAGILDAGHDGKPIYQYLLHHEITPVIPLKTSAPASHPNRSEISLSRRAVPLCHAGQEMICRGNNGKGGQIFACPVKAKKLERCPMAPESEERYNCCPRKELGHTVVIKISDNERLFPPIPRNHPQYRTLMNLRSGSERSFAVKKGPFKLEQARHRRASFWLVRNHLMAVLQHAMAWVKKMDASALVDKLLGRRDGLAA